MSKFLERIIERAKTDKKTIVLPEGFDERVVKAAVIAQKAGFACLGSVA